MVLKILNIRPQLKSLSNNNYYKTRYDWTQLRFQTAIPEQEKDLSDAPNAVASRELSPANQDALPTARAVPMVVRNRESVVLPFHEVPGPKSLKYFATVRSYLSEIGTQLTAGLVIFGLNIGSYVNTQKPLKNLSVLFDKFGPVVRFVSPVGRDIVLTNNPHYIQKIYSLEGERPIRSTLDSLVKYRTENKSRSCTGLYSICGQEWSRYRTIVYNPLNDSVANHIQGINELCEIFTQKIYNMRNYQDEINNDLYKEIHMWAYDCMGLIIFSKSFTELENDLVRDQFDTTLLYNSLEKVTEAVIKCESGWHFWKLFSTPAWRSLVKHCEEMDNLIGKHVVIIEQSLTYKETEENLDKKSKNSFISTMLLGEEKVTIEDISTILMDMLLIGVNTITSSTSFLLYFLAKHQFCQKKLYQEIENVYRGLVIDDINKVKQSLPYLQACIKETLRLVPPMPVLTRILPRNITLDKYNIPRGTLIIMSTRDASLNENNYDDATKFQPERWLQSDIDYHPFASIPYGYGARKCLGQTIAETMMSLITIKLLQKYKLEYYYGDIQPTRNFITRPQNPLRLRFVDRA